MKDLLPRVRNLVYRLLRPIYRRVPMLQRLRQKLPHWKSWVFHRAVDSRSLDNLRALQALSARRFEIEEVKGCTAYVAKEPPYVDMSVVTYNSSRWVKPFIASLLSQAFPLNRIHLCFVDNGSSDDTVEALKEELRSVQGLASTTFIQQANLGFGAGHDRAIRSGKSEYCLVTNIDLEFQKDALTQVVNAAVSDPDPNVASWELRQVPYEHPKYYDPVTLETNWSSHACVLLRRKAYEKVGGYDRRIFMYAEDVELSYRLRSYGYVLKYVPRAVVLHHTYESAGQIKPTQFTGSTLGNLYLRLRYGTKADRRTGLLLYAGLLAMPAPYKGARRQIARNAVSIMRNWRHFRRGKGPAMAYFPFRGFDYELRRDGAFIEVKPVPESLAPRVSIITRTYQGRAMFLRQAVRSVFNQTYPNLELIVVQDGGNSQRAVVEEMASGVSGKVSVRFLEVPKDGRSSAGNAGLAAATGEYLMFLDDDDLLFADHVEALVTKLLADTTVSAAYARSMEIFTDYDAVADRYIEERIESPEVFRQEWDYKVLTDHNFIPIQAIIFKRELFEQRGGFDVELDQLEDWHLWLRYGYRNTFAFVNKTTSLFRSPARFDVRAARAHKLHEAYDEAKTRALQRISQLRSH